MDFHQAMETFAEAWVAANTHTAVSASESSQHNHRSVEDLPTSFSLKDHPQDTKMASTHQEVSGQSSHKLPGSLSSPQPTTAKTLPIHCIVEQTVIENPSKEPQVELDTYAIVPGTTLFTEVVRTALLKVGYTASEALGAKGAIQIKKWKPLNFENITENPEATVEELLGDLTSHATLRIRLCRPPRDIDLTSVAWNDEHVRCAVVALLKEMNQTTLAKLSPMSQSMISNIANAKYIARIGPEKCQEFATWYKLYRAENNGLKNNMSQFISRESRLTFHPLYELPRMRQWFNFHNVPTDADFRELCDELNNGTVRQQRPKITVPKLKMWWRNEKQRLKRGKVKKEKPPKGGDPTDDTTKDNNNPNSSASSTPTGSGAPATSENNETNQSRFNREHSTGDPSSGGLSQDVLLPSALTLGGGHHKGGDNRGHDESMRHNQRSPALGSDNGRGFGGSGSGIGSHGLDMDLSGRNLSSSEDMSRDTLNGLGGTDERTTSLVSNLSSRMAQMQTSSANRMSGINYSTSTHQYTRGSGLNSNGSMNNHRGMINDHLAHPLLPHHHPLNSLSIRQGHRGMDDVGDH